MTLSDNLERWQDGHRGHHCEAAHNGAVDCRHLLWPQPPPVEFVLVLHTSWQRQQQHESTDMHTLQPSSSKPVVKAVGMPASWLRHIGMYTVLLVVACCSSDSQCRFLKIVTLSAVRHQASTVTWIPIRSASSEGWQIRQLFKFDMATLCPGLDRIHGHDAGPITPGSPFLRKTGSSEDAPIACPSGDKVPNPDTVLDASCA